MKFKTLILTVFVSITCVTGLYAQSYLQFVENKGQWNNKVAFKGELASGAFFIERHGGYKLVLHDHNDLRALLDQHHGAASANSNKPKSDISGVRTVLHSHAYEVTFQNSNAAPEVVSEKPLTSYNNYYIGNDPSKWATKCRIFQAITYKNVYNNIDVRYYTSSTGQLKYDLIVHPGGDPENIALNFDGADELKVKNGSLAIKTSVDQVQEATPYSYISSLEGRKEINCNYSVHGNTVKFKISGKRDPNATLVIDPTLVFSSFTGSKADNWGYTATYDAAGNFYGGGIVFGTGFPLTNGAYFQNYVGGVNYDGNDNGAGFDMGIIKLSSDGSTLMYGTYLGGATGNEQPHSLVVDNAGNLIVAGRTSSNDYPVYPAGNVLGDGCKNGDFDICITKFDPTGAALIGSIRLGGAKDDGINIADKEHSVQPQQYYQYSLRRNYGDDARSEVNIDAGGNIYMVSCTQSSDFPTVNAFQTTNGGGQFNQDAVIIKLSSNLSSVLFSTYFGGTGDDAAFVLAINPLNNLLYVAGGTVSTDLPGNTTGSLFSTNQGSVDGFVSIINTSGSTPQIQQTGYFGTSGIDLIYGIQFDQSGFPYIMGTTTASWPVVNAPFSQSGGKQFIAKIKPDLSAWVYSTVFGTNSPLQPNISPTAFLVDICENVYVSGWGGGQNQTGYLSQGTSGLTTTSNALKLNSSGNDFYFFVMAKDAASQLYGSFFGQDPPYGWPNHVDGGTSRFDKNGVIYQAMCANCFGAGLTGAGDFPVTPGAYATVNGTTVNGSVQACNLALVKIAFNLAGASAGVQSSIDGRVRDSSGCSPISVDFKDTIGTAKKYIWDYGDGTPDTVTTASSVSHLYTLPGNYLVRLIGIDTTKCFPYDTSYVTIRLGTDSVSLALNFSRVGACSSNTFQFNNLSVGAPGTVPFPSNSFRIDYGDGSSAILGTGSVQHTYAAIGSYNVSLVLVDSNYCNQYDSITLPLKIANLVKAQFTTPVNGCAPYTAQFTNTSTGGLSYKWVFGDGTTDSVNNANTVSHLYAGIQQYSVYMVAYDSATCNKFDTSSIQTISVEGKPTALFTVTPQPPVANTPIIFNNNSAGGVLFKWFFGDGDSTITTSTYPVSHQYNTTGTFKASLIVVNNAGCLDTLSQSVQTYVIPLFDVPNAFSPNGDGINDVIYVQGFGISSIKWNIYNRWGTLVFTSTNISNGWDGRYKGVPQPQDVYQYALEVQMTNGDVFTKKGDITLLR